MSESASTSCSFPSSLLLLVLFLLSPSLFEGSGDVIALLPSLLGVEPLSSWEVLCSGDAGFEPGIADVLLERFLSCSRFSNVPRSVRPLSSSLRRPEARLVAVSKASTSKPRSEEEGAREIERTGQSQ
jgi:hypothetical protein